MKKTTHVAILCANGLGDAMVQMVLANNLARQGLDVTFYSSIAASLDPMVSAYTILPFPDYDVLLPTLQSADLCLYDSSGHYVRNMPAEIESWCEANAVCYRMSDAPPRHTRITEQTIAARLTAPAVTASQFKALNASLRGKFYGFYRDPVAVQLRDFLMHQVGLKDVVLGNGLSAGVVKKNRSKIVIHPTGSNSKKCWPADKYITLVSELTAMGFTPSITVSPAERDHWLTWVDGACDVPIFNTIAELATYYADAACLIGSDSGNAHLASCLGVPTVQFFSGWKAHPAWRAGWGPNQVITAAFPYSLVKKGWHKGLSVERALTEMSRRDVATMNFTRDPS